MDSATSICRKHGIYTASLYKWSKEYEEGELNYAGTGEKNWESLPKEIRVRQIEELIGRMCIELDLLKKMNKNSQVRTSQRQKSQSSLIVKQGVSPSKTHAE